MARPLDRLRPSDQSPQRNGSGAPRSLFDILHVTVPPLESVLEGQDGYMTWLHIFTLIGGLGAFLFGMKYMGDGLEAAAGPKMNNMLEKLTRNPLLGFLVGTVVTAVIQSSSATTVMVMGFLNAGIMDLAQATGVIIGANIGTTMTSILIALDVSAISPICIFAGAALLLYSKRANKRHIGQIILGFGILFQGLHTMSGAMSVLKEMEAFQRFITTASNPFLGVLVGAVMCAVIQSSSAGVGVLQALALQGLMPIHFASYLICGINIGSAAPPFLAAINAKNNAKRASFIYFFYNIFGTLLFVPITMFTPYTAWLEKLFPGNEVVQVAACHIIFKLVTALVLLPFTRAIVRLSYRVIPKQKHEGERRLLYIDQNLNTSPGVMLLQLQKEVKRMAELVRDNFVLSSEGLLADNLDEAHKVRDQEEMINFLNHAITDYLVKVNALELPDDVSEYIGRLFHVINDLERIGDHALNLIERTESCLEKGLIYSETARKEIESIYENSLLLFDCAIGAFLNGELSDEEELRLHSLEENIDQLTLESQDSHIIRLRAKECHTEPGIIFVKVLHDLERVGDHSYNIAWAAKAHANLLREV